MRQWRRRHRIKLEKTQNCSRAQPSTCSLSQTSYKLFYNRLRLLIGRIHQFRRSSYRNKKNGIWILDSPPRVSEYRQRRWSGNFTVWTNIFQTFHDICFGGGRCICIFHDLGMYVWACAGTFDLFWRLRSSCHSANDAIARQTNVSHWFHLESRLLISVKIVIAATFRKMK